MKTVIYIAVLVACAAAVPARVRRGLAKESVFEASPAESVDNTATEVKPDAPASGAELFPITDVGSENQPPPLKPEDVKKLSKESRKEKDQPWERHPGMPPMMGPGPMGMPPMMGPGPMGMPPMMGPGPMGGPQGMGMPPMGGPQGMGMPGPQGMGMGRQGMGMGPQGMGMRGPQGMGMGPQGMGMGPQGMGMGPQGMGMRGPQGMGMRGPQGMGMRAPQGMGTGFQVMGMQGHQGMGMPPMRVQPGSSQRMPPFMMGQRGQSPMGGPMPPFMQQGMQSDMQGPMPPNMHGDMPPYMQDDMPPHMHGDMPPNMRGPMPPHMQGRMPPFMPMGMPPNMRGPMPPSMRGPMPPNMRGPMPPMMENGMPPMMQGDMPKRGKLSEMFIRGPGDHDDADIDRFLDFEGQIEGLRKAVLRSFYRDLVTFRALSKAYQTKMLAKLALIKELEARISMPIRSDVAISNTMPAHTEGPMEGVVLKQTGPYPPPPSSETFV